MVVKEMKSRTELYAIFAKRGYKTGAEIGVDRALNAIDMLEHIPDLFLYLIDPWKGRAARRSYSRRRRYANAMKRLAPYSKAFTVIKETSLKASLEIPDKLLVFVYIDGNHEYDFAMLDTIIWIPKIRDGGIISGHDYRRGYYGVKPAIDDYVKYHGIELHIIPQRNWYFEI